MVDPYNNQAPPQAWWSDPQQAQVDSPNNGNVVMHVYCTQDAHTTWLVLRETTASLLWEKKRER